MLYEIYVTKLRGQVKWIVTGISCFTARKLTLVLVKKIKKLPKLFVIEMINKYQTDADVRPASAAVKGLGHEINSLFECLMRRWFFKSVDASILEKSKSKFLLQWNYLLILNIYSVTL
jgi:hypothetical protein